MCIWNELTGSCCMFSREAMAKGAGIDPSWAVNSSHGCVSSPAWLQLYLAACKLLDLALALPADFLPQFQLLVVCSITSCS